VRLDGTTGGFLFAVSSYLRTWRRWEESLLNGTTALMYVVVETAATLVLLVI
jgi:hypothetical protein